MKKLFAGLHKFQTNYFKEHRDLFEHLGHEQYPYPPRLGLQN
jgi:carbonic anhydrase